jgi:plasmid stability protein
MASKSTKPSVNRGLDQMQVRLPDGMRDALKKRAQQNRRSMNSELIVILESELAFEERTA